ncbi:DUF2231 domain-containing protein [Adhaeribacter aquaticus]|uniref:DUF2231 domain-containing protein n=1 Tax=Adhaeribacter aquaticus TaxID=299567 RepID=UPI00040158B5|nr:DUF2231 domain-containing protein [Adhaeribacter aquaticus]
MFSEFPNLHPLVVHFPIVLILLGAALQSLLVFKDWQQVRWGCLIILGGGFLGALLASTIFHAMPSGLSPQATEVFYEHEKYSSYTLWLSGITFLLKGIGEFFKIFRRSYEILVFGFALVAAIFLSLAGHRGAQLVYVEGVGPKGNLLMKGDHHHGGSVSKREEMPQQKHAEGGHSPEIVPDAKARHEPGAGMEENHTQPMEQMAHDEPATNNVPMPAGTMPGKSGSSNPPRKTNAPKEMDMARMNHSNMPGMETPTRKKSTANPKQNMPGMNHQQMIQRPSPNQAMDHGNMPGMNQSPKTPITNQQMQNSPETGNKPGMDHNNMNTKTDMNGRPLIDATKPYDNNPGREAIKRKPNP